MTPCLDILPPAQRAVWPELTQVPRHFVLYGGTAIALRYAHRISVDFDFFTDRALPHRALLALALLRDVEILQEDADTLTCVITRGAPVKISFFGKIAFGRVGAPDIATEIGLKIASPLDLAATKLKVLLQRVEAKDYFDIACLLRNGIRLEQMLAAARTLFDRGFNPLMAQKTLSYFEGGDLEQVDKDTRELLCREATRDFELPPCPKSSVSLD